jgi:hypothetical protein
MTHKFLLALVFLSTLKTVPAMTIRTTLPKNFPVTFQKVGQLIPMISYSHLKCTIDGGQLKKEISNLRKGLISEKPTPENKVAFHIAMMMINDTQRELETLEKAINPHSQEEPVKRQLLLGKSKF